MIAIAFFAGLSIGLIALVVVSVRSSRRERELLDRTEALATENGVLRMQVNNARGAKVSSPGIRLCPVSPPPTLPGVDRGDRGGVS